MDIKQVTQANVLLGKIDLISQDIEAWKRVEFIPLKNRSAAYRDHVSLPAAGICKSMMDQLIEQAVASLENQLASLKRELDEL